MEGGIQVNVEGKRFSNEHEGYSEQAVKVLAQPEQVAFNIFDKRLLAIGREFEDFRNAETANAIISADSIRELSTTLNLPFENLQETFEYCSNQAVKEEPDKFGRVFSLEKLLKPPFFAVKVTGALFHTQGGLAIDEKARVIKNDGSVIQGLFACGGAVCGVSGPDVSGYLSGNGLLTAIGLGYLAGREA
jgi:fumarate reductase flavoprotein subunit